VFPAELSPPGPADSALGGGEHGPDSRALHC
jgi:hypothetical protein